MTSSSAKVLEENFSFGPWKILAKKGPILKSSDIEKIKSDLRIPEIPEMVFGDTLLEIQHHSGFAISFNAVDALDRVDKENDLMKVSAADEWQKQRSGCEFIKNVVKPYDWTYTTDYQGTLRNCTPQQVIETDERLDIEKLKKHEKIHFYQDLLLFEDELGDHGIAKLNVKMRVMPSSFFLLLRFFLRVDGVLIRIHDTRLFHEAGTNYILREYRENEKEMKFLTVSTRKKVLSKDVDVEIQNPLADENVLLEELTMKKETFHKLMIENDMNDR